MRQINYLDSKDRQVRKQWKEDVSGVVVLQLKDSNYYIHRCADIYEFLCSVRYGLYRNSFIDKHGVDYTKKPLIYLAKFESSRLDLVLLFNSVLNLYINEYGTVAVRTTDYDNLELTDTDHAQLLLKANHVEDFYSIWKTDEENEADNRFKLEQERLQTEQKNKENQEALKKVQAYEQSLVDKHLKELDKFKKSVGIKVPKQKFNNKQKEKLAWKLFN